MSISLIILRMLWLLHWTSLNFLLNRNYKHLNSMSYFVAIEFWMLTLTFPECRFTQFYPIGSAIKLDSCLSYSISSKWTIVNFQCSRNAFLCSYETHASLIVLLRSEPISALITISPALLLDWAWIIHSTSEVLTDLSRFTLLLFSMPARFTD